MSKNIIRNEIRTEEGTSPHCLPTPAGTAHTSDDSICKKPHDVVGSRDRSKRRDSTQFNPLTPVCPSTESEVDRIEVSGLLS